MALKKSKVEAVTETATVKYKEDTLNAVFAPHKITEERLRAISEDAKVGFNTGYLHNCLVSWDYLDDKDKPLPITIPELSAMGIDLTNALVAAISAVMNPTPPG